MQVKNNFQLNYALGTHCAGSILLSKRHVRQKKGGIKK